MRLEVVIVFYYYYFMEVSWKTSKLRLEYSDFKFAELFLSHFKSVC